MALTLLQVGKVDPNLQSGSGQPLDVSAAIVDITLGATSDYSSGVDLTSSVIIGSTSPALNVSQIVGIANASVRTSGGTLKPLGVQFDVTTKKLRLFRQGNTLFSNAVQRQNQTNALTGPLAANAFTLPANTLSAAGAGVRARIWGHRSAVANAVTINIKVGATIAAPPVGGTTIATITGTANAVATDWLLQMEMLRVSAGNQSTIVWGYDGIANSNTLTNVVPTILFTATTFDETTDLTIQPMVTGTNTNDITIEGQVFELLGTSNAQGVEIIPAADLAAGDIVRATLLCI